MADEYILACRNYLDDIVKRFQSLKELSDKAFVQLSEADFHFIPDPESNSIAVMMKHIAGNMISRWTDFLTSDGEKSNRNRDSEFADEFKSHAELIEFWEKGWKCLFDAITPLTPDDLTKTVLIRKESHTVIDALNRQLSHYAYHIGQIIFLAKLIKSGEWKSLSIPRNRSQDYNKTKGM